MEIDVPRNARATSRPATGALPAAAARTAVQTGAVVSTASVATRKRTGTVNRCHHSPGDPAAAAAGSPTARFAADLRPSFRLVFSPPLNPPTVVRSHRHQLHPGALTTAPVGQVVFENTAPVRSASVRSAPVRSAPVGSMSTSRTGNVRLEEARQLRRRPREVGRAQVGVLGLNPSTPLRPTGRLRSDRPGEVAAWARPGTEVLRSGWRRSGRHHRGSPGRSVSDKSSSDRSHPWRSARTPDVAVDQQDLSTGDRLTESDPDHRAGSVGGRHGRPDV